MADNEGEETISNVHGHEAPKTSENKEGPRGNDWEVVSLTASAYAAAPGPRGGQTIHEDSDSTVIANEEAETYRALLMSGHFVFPPSEHENLPIAPEKPELPEGDKPDYLVPETNGLKEGKSEEKVDEKSRIKGVDVTKACLSTHDHEYNNFSDRHGLNADNAGEDLYEAGNVIYVVETSENTIDPVDLISQSPVSGKEDEAEVFGLPCEAWWKRGVASLCAQAKETSTFWSIFVAAAVMGLVVLGQRWQQERWQVLHQKWQLSVGDEKSGRILSRFKDLIVGGSRRGTYVTATTSEH